MKFRRQRPIGRYIVDFVCLERLLIVEVDGGHHAEQRRYDETRDAWLKSQGFSLIRFSDRDVLLQPEWVARAISEALRAVPLPNLPRLRGRGQKAPHAALEG